jgi:hypothetical protein
MSESAGIPAETTASKFCRMIRDHSSFKVGRIAKTTTWWNSLPMKSGISRGVPALVQAINSAKNASTSDISVNSWASKRRSQPTTN